MSGVVWADLWRGRLRQPFCVTYRRLWIGQKMQQKRRTTRVESAIWGRRFKGFWELKNSTLKSQILVVSCLKKCSKNSFKNRGCKTALSSDFVKHSSSFGPRDVVFKACSEGTFLAKCAKFVVISNVFENFEYGFVKKHWFLQHSVGVALCSSRALGAKFDECFGKSKETDAQPIAPEAHSTSEIRLRATKK